MNKSNITQGQDHMSERHYILISNRVRANVAIESLKQLMGPIDGEQYGITLNQEITISHTIMLLQQIEQRIFRMMI